MTLTIPDDTLDAAGLTEGELRIEIACRLYAAGKLAFGPAERLAGLGRTEFEEALIQREIVVYPITPGEVEADLRTLQSLGF